MIPSGELGYSSSLADASDMPVTDGLPGLGEGTSDGHGGKLSSPLEMGDSDRVQDCAGEGGWHWSGSIPSTM